MVSFFILAAIGIRFGLCEAEQSQALARGPCVVLVINDNPYRLMVALSYMCRTCP
jgi:hypothetical protein